MASHKTDYFVHVFHALGAPLVQASLSHLHAGGLDLKTIAQIVAELLTKSVQAGIDLGALVQIEQQGDTAESARVALTALAAQMIGDFYAQNKKIPETADLQAIVEGLKTVMNFTQNFEASPEAALRVDAMHAKSVASVDNLQSKVQIIGACVPIVQAVSAAPMGQNPTELSGKIVAKIQDKMRMIIGLDAKGSADAGRDVLTSLARVYADIHRSEAQKPSPSVDQAWADFEAQFGIIHVLTESIVSPDAAAPAAPSAPVQQNPVSEAPVQAAPVSPAVPEQGVQSAPPQNDAPPAVPPVFDQPIQTPKDPPVEPPPSIISPVGDAPQADAPSTPEQDKPANPMGFFAKKPTQDDAPVAPPAAPPIPPSEPDSTPSTPDIPPPSAPPEIPAVPDDSAHDMGGQSSAAPDEKPAAANPMAFFTKKNDAEDDE